MKKLTGFLLLLVLMGLASFSWSDELSGYIKDFNKALKSKNPEQIANSVRNIGKANSKKAVQFVLKVALAAENWTQAGMTDSAVLQIHKAALEGLQSVTDSQAVSYLISQATSHRNWKVRVLLIDVIKDKGTPETNEALAKCLKTSRQEVLLAALEAIKEKKVTKAVPALIDLVDRYKRQKGLVWIEARRSLLAITGQDFETTSDWKKWWSTVKNNFNPSSSGDVGSGRTALRMNKKHPKLFGTEIYSKRVIFILDVSGSMMMKDPEQGEGGGTVVPQPGKAGQASIPEHRRRMTRAKNELVKVVKMLDSDVRFNIITFSNVIKKWKDQYLYPANAGNKASAIKWIENMNASGTTWTDLALKEGFKFQEANTIYLLSDGSPTHDGQTMLPTGPICEMVKNMNKFRRVRVFTLAFVGANTPFMQRLADENNGKYTDIK